MGFGSAAPYQQGTLSEHIYHFNLGIYVNSGHVDPDIGKILLMKKSRVALINVRYFHYFLDLA